MRLDLDHLRNSKGSPRRLHLDRDTINMRLINADTYELEEFFDNRIPPYGILSHTWEDEEVTFRDIQDIEGAKKIKGFIKVHYACEQALFNGLDYVWLDTCKCECPPAKHCRG
jgi:hypothetical protein